MTVKKPNSKEQTPEIVCPNCRANIDIEDLGMMMFESCTVFSCPICKKTIAIQPKGQEFQIPPPESQEESESQEN